MAGDFDDTLDPRLSAAGRAVQALPCEQPPRDLIARTLAHIANNYQKPVKRVFWMLRPITHPLARFAAAAVIIAALFPMTDLNIADPIGKQIEKRIFGHAATTHIERMLDRFLVRHYPANCSQEDLDELIGIPRPDFVPVRPRRVACVSFDGV